MKASRVVPLIAVLCAFSLASCANTVTGVSKDVKGTAQAVKKAVK
ncbi:entericidin EcnAB [Phyllobacterium leguminum]|uniref:Small secreted protein n=1 Tax=Phyllobacterium leguminum TaxID=314237 RepID=A0A318T506_9HYPH|nr:entericidin EcnAB [Phyllobacterium leguminum]PYE90059.1 hypothetical protein C7477_102147 [Phyllobacterium leguminum]